MSGLIKKRNAAYQAAQGYFYIACVSPDSENYASFISVSLPGLDVDVGMLPTVGVTMMKRL